MKAFGIMLLSLLLVVVFTVNAHSVLAYTPQKGDYFDYSETVTVNNGQGSYSGYTDQTLTTGTEQMNSVDGSIVMAAYRSSYQFSNSQGSSTSGSYSGAFTWSSSNFTYVNGTDDQTGYSKPTYVWFAMNPSLPVGGTFEILNTQFTVLSKDYSLQLPTEGDEYVQTIQAKGTGEYQRNDEYGIFTASYTWNAYFDSSTGYIVGYNYVEQDNGQYQGQAGSFTYTDDLYVTATSYTLALASAAGTSLIGTVPYISYLVVLVVVVLIIAIVVYVATRGARRKNRLPEHSHVPSSPPAPSSSPTPWESKTDLGSRPPEQVVIKEVAKVNCKYCGTLIPTTVDRCPYCGGPRQ